MGGRGQWRRGPPRTYYHCKALIALPVIRRRRRVRRAGGFVYDIADIHTEAARLARMPRWFRALVRWPRAEVGSRGRPA